MPCTPDQTHEEGECTWGREESGNIHMNAVRDGHTYGKHSHTSQLNLSHIDVGFNNGINSSVDYWK